MIFYRIEPKDPMSPSRRWFVDEVGEKLVKELYSNYNGTNRLDDFNYAETKEIWFDFGGMMRMNTPKVFEMYENVKFELHVTHVATLLEALKSPRHSHNNWQCGTRFNSYVFSLETRDKLIELFTKKFELYQEMIEGFDKEMDETIKNSKHLIGMKKYHKDPPK